MVRQRNNKSDNPRKARRKKRKKGIIQGLVGDLPPLIDPKPKKLGRKSWDDKFEDFLATNPIGVSISSAFILALTIYIIIGSGAYDAIGLWIAIPILVVTLICAYLIIRATRKHSQVKSAEMDLDKYIREALHEMDALGGTYSDEESANQQLCLMLRRLAPNADVRLVRQGSNDMGDIRVGNTIIEGKLDLVTKDELDRLVGQLQDYCYNSNCQIRVVVYGKLRPEFRRRIEGLREYYSRIILHHIEGIKTRKRFDEY